MNISLVDKTIQSLDATKDEKAMAIAQQLREVHHDLQSRRLLPASIRHDTHQAVRDSIRKQRKAVDALLVKTTLLAKNKKMKSN